MERVYEVLKQYKTLTINRDILDLEDIKEPRILSDLKGLVKFCEKFDVKGIVVTKDILKEEGNILFIPAWLFLLIVS